MAILIDTRLLGLALKAPYYGEHHLVRPIAEQAQRFVREQVDSQVLAVSPQLLGELYHVLTERGLRITKTLAQQLVDDLLQGANIIYRSPDVAIIQEAIALSARTCVHIWDFLIVLPFRGILERIYTTDPHFLSCKNLQVAPVENPLGLWVTEGKTET
ncbi:MAG: hypothetical protein NZ805_06170 [Armatimonadetes bacterium]|nr:hypothetical protein [Armatimonadota bacterium]MDW8027674.1 hypothetical protein [Armatimonadota bacterium]